MEWNNHWGFEGACSQKPTNIFAWKWPLLYLHAAKVVAVRSCCSYCAVRRASLLLWRLIIVIIIIISRFCCIFHLTNVGSGADAVSDVTASCCLMWMANDQWKDSLPTEFNRARDDWVDWLLRVSCCFHYDAIQHVWYRLQWRALHARCICRLLGKMLKKKFNTSYARPLARSPARGFSTLCPVLPCKFTSLNTSTGGPPSTHPPTHPLFMHSAQSNNKGKHVLIAIALELARTSSYVCGKLPMVFPG